MFKYFQYILIVSITIVFTACSAKDVKKVGSNASNAGALGLIVGGAIYGVGSLMEDDEKKESKDEYYNEPRNSNYVLKEDK